MLANQSCLLYYLRERRHEFNVVLDGLIPLAGIAVFVPAFFKSVGITLVGPVDEIGMGVGVLYLVYLYARHPERSRDIGRMFLEEEPPVPAAPVTASPAGPPA